MGSKRSLKPSKKRLLDTDIVKKDDVEEQKPQQSRMSWKMKYELINSDTFSNGAEEEKNSSEGEEQVINESKPVEEEKKPVVKKKEHKQKTTVLAGLSGYLSSSESDSDSSDQEPDINSEVQAFLKEVDNIKFDSDGNPIEPEEKKQEKASTQAAALDKQQQAMRGYYAAHGYSMPTTSWQECYDSSSGYSYYWNVDTNEVRWEIPPEYQYYLATVKQLWEEYNRTMYSAQYRSDAANRGVSVNTSHLAATQLSSGKGSAARGAGAQGPPSETAVGKDSVQKGSISSKGTITPNAKRKSTHHSDSEDEKIELITSYGPNSDDQSSEDDSPGNDSKQIKRKRRSTDTDEISSGKSSQAQEDLTEKARLAEEKERQEELKRRLASRQEDVKKLLAIKKEEVLKNKKRSTGSVNDGPPSKKQSSDSDEIHHVEVSPAGVQVETPASPVKYKPELPTDGDAPSPGEVELVERLKSQAEVLKKLGGELPEGVSRIIFEQSSKPAMNEGSLVAGYEEDDENSENEENESSEAIVEPTLSKVEKAVKELPEENGNKQAAKDDRMKTDSKPVAAAGERVSKKVLKLSAKAKQLINASETTKRARQTDFVNTPLGLRPANSTGVEPAAGSQNQDEKDDTDGDKITKRSGLGYSADSSEKFKTGKLVQFVSAGTTKDTGEVDLSTDANIEDCKELLMAKMKFLSEGKEPPSPVQIWTGQLEILHKAWESKCLKGEFLSRWLQTMVERLTQLESTAAPPGWHCLWSREERRYCYKRLDSGQVVWEFPVSAEDEELAVQQPPPTVEVPPASSSSPAAVEAPEEPVDPDDGQGEIEMDLCMTPPPPPTPPSPPPPPVISNAPSPPPPPLISYSSDNSTSESVPPLPDETPPPLPDEAPPPLPDEAPPLPLDEAPPLPPGEPLPPGLEPPHPELPYTPPPLPVTPPAQVPRQITPPPRTLISHPPPQDYGHIVMTPASYHHLAYHQMHYGAQSQYSSAYVSAAPIPAPLPPKVVEVENKPNNLSSELDSFYSDLATLEPEEEEQQASGSGVSEESASTPLPAAAPPLDCIDIPPPASSPDPAPLKKRKKPKLAPGLALKKKGVSSLVAKWQKVQQSARRDF